MVKGLTLAIASNPIGAIAVAVTALGVAAYTYSDNIADFFGFAETAPDELEATDTELKKLNKTVDKTIENEEEKVEIAKDFVKFNKKDVIPNLKALEEGLGETQLKFVNLTGREGLGGIQLAFLNFFGNVWADATFYLGGTSATIKKNFSNMKQDFEEFFKALDNIVIFEGNDVKSAFSAIMRNLEEQVKDLKIQVEGITIDIPASAFSFASTNAKVPGTIFDFTAVRTAAGAIDSLVEQINTYSYSDTASSTTRKAMAYTHEQSNVFSMVGPYWSDEVPMHDAVAATFRNLTTPIPSVDINGSSASAPSSPASPSPASKNASKGGGDNGVIVNVFDGTGQKISEYDSSIRVQITERASRNSQFAALV